MSIKFNSAIFITIMMITSLFLISCSESTKNGVSEKRPQDFFSVFQQAYKSGDYEKMLVMTSQESIDKYGRVEILNHYKTYLQFGYELTYTGNYKDGKYIILIYDAVVWGTKGSCKVKTLPENGKLKIVLNDLDGPWGRSIQEGI